MGWPSVWATVFWVISSWLTLWIWHYFLDQSWVVLENAALLSLLISHAWLLPCSRHSTFCSSCLPLPLPLVFMVWPCQECPAISPPHFVLNWIILLQDDFESCLRMFFFQKCRPDIPRFFSPSLTNWWWLWFELLNKTDKQILELPLTFCGALHLSCLPVCTSGFWNQSTWVQFWALSFSSWVSLDKLLNCYVSCSLFLLLFFLNF